MRAKHVIRNNISEGVNEYFSLTKIATPVMSTVVGIKDFTYPNSFGMENFGSPWGISPT